MAYTAWSVVFGEQPTAAKWNQLGANDAGFKDGTNIDNNAILDRHILAANLIANKFYNPYKFSVYRVGATSTASGSQRANFDTKRHDTSSNYSTSTFRFTAPIAGFYQFNAGVSIAAVTPTRLFPSFFKNGVELNRGTDIASANQGASVSAHLQLAANDYIEFWFYINLTGGTYNNAFSYMDGFLVSAT